MRITLSTTFSTDFFRLGPDGPVELMQWMSSGHPIFKGAVGAPEHEVTKRCTAVLVLSLLTATV